MKVLFAILLVDLLAFTSILPLFPAILDHYEQTSKDVRTLFLTHYRPRNILLRVLLQDVIYQRLDSWLVAFRSLIGAGPGFNSVFFGGSLSPDVSISHLTVDLRSLSGLLGSIFSFLQFLSSPIAGALSDVFGRKPILLLSVVSPQLCSSCRVIGGPDPLDWRRDR